MAKKFVFPNSSHLAKNTSNPIKLATAFVSGSKVNSSFKRRVIQQVLEKIYDKVKVFSGDIETPESLFYKYQVTCARVNKETPFFVFLDNILFGVLHDRLGYYALRSKFNGSSVDIWYIQYALVHVLFYVFSTESYRLSFQVNFNHCTEIAFEFITALSPVPRGGVPIKISYYTHGDNEPGTEAKSAKKKI